MVRAYTVVDDREFVIAIGLIRNEIDKDLPADLADYVRKALQNVGKPFVTVKVVPDEAQLNTAASMGLTFLAAERPKPPAAALVLRGAVSRADDVIVSDSTLRVGVLAGKKSISIDAARERENRDNTSTWTVGLTVESSNGVAIPGASAMYRVHLVRSERNGSRSGYVAGSGAGEDFKLAVAQEGADALYDATALGVMDVLARALLLPAYRADPRLPAAPTIVVQLHDVLNRLTRAQLEQHVKRFLWLAGFSMDLASPTLTDKDRAVAVVEMQHHGLDFNDRRALVEFAVKLWTTLDYRTAAQRVVDRLVDSTRLFAEVAEQQRSLVVSPKEFGWPDSTPVVVLDWSQVVKADPRRKILAALRASAWCKEIRLHPAHALVGIRTSSSAADVQRALRQTNLSFDYVWTDAQLPYLRLTEVVSPR
jgi:hypothetical protein